MSQFKYILPVATVSFCLGILQSELSLSWYIFGVTAIGLLLLGSAFCGRKVWIWFLTVVVIFGLGFAQNENKKHVTNENEIDYYIQVAEGVNLRGYVSEFADTRENHTLLTVETQDVQIGDRWREAHGKVLITAREYPEYDLGDWLEASCVLQTPIIFEDFDYRAYLAKNDIYATCFYPKISAISANNPTNWAGARLGLMSKINFVRKKIINGIDRVFPEPSGSFLEGILLGQRQHISEEIIEDFRITGLSHILAISGMNVVIIIGFLTYFLGWLPRWVRFALISILLIVFALMVGASASIVRAVIMGIVGLFALANFRQSNSVSALCVAGITMLAINPKLLIYDVGFQLSFLAVLGIVCFYQDLLRVLQKIAKVKFLWEALALTLSAQLLTAPIVAWNFEQISLVSPLANFLILPIIPFLMLFGFLGGMCGIFSVGLGKILGFWGWIVFKFSAAIIGFLASIPYASLETKIGNIWLVLVYYLVLGGIVLYLKQKSSLTQKKKGVSRGK